MASRVLEPQILAYGALPGTEYLPEYVSCDVLARIGMILLNKLMGTAGRAENAGCSGNEVASTTTFLYVISMMFYRRTIPSNSIEF
jgi:hypothetical protein